jgi:glyoxylase-like metal-dependent hydrolase (beta-lactamase superfamily II)
MIHRSAFAAIAVLALSAGASLAGDIRLTVPFPEGSPVTPADGYLYEAERIAPRVHMIASPEPFHLQPYGNVTVIEQDDGLVLVDSGGTRAGAERVIALVERISRKPVKAIIITHWHGDHSNGLRTLVSRWPTARTISTPQTRATLSDPRTESFMPSQNEESNAAIQRNYAEAVTYFRAQSTRDGVNPSMRSGYETAAREFENYGRELVGGARLAPVEGVSDRLLIADPVAPVEVLFLGRANTDGDAVVWLPRQRVIATGDIVVSPIPYGFGSFPADWIGVLNRLKGYDFDTLIPGHGRPMKDRKYLDLLIAVLNDVRGQVAPLAAQGKTLEEVQAGVDLSAHVAAFAGTDAWRVRVFDMYWKVSIVESAYKEAKGIPMIQGAE